MAQPQPWQRDAARGAYVRHLSAMKASTADIAAALRDAAIAAERQVEHILGRGVGAQMRRAQLRTVALALRENQAALWPQVSEATRRGIRGAGAAAADSQVFFMEYLTRTGIPGARPALEGQLVNAARYSAESIRAKYMNSVQLSPLVYKNQQVGIARAHRAVRQGLATNRSAKEIAGSVRHLINPSTRGGVSYAAMRLARTEINNAFHAINTEWNSKTPWVNGVKWELSMSHPQPDECDDYAEQDDYGLGQGVWKPEDVPHKPHPHCLCYTVAVTVEPSRFYDELLNGNYDGWMAEQGLSPIGVARSA